MWYQRRNKELAYQTKQTIEGMDGGPKSTRLTSVM